MSNLVRYNSNGIELVINQETGAAYATQAGYLRMSGKAKSTISERVAKGFGAGNIIEAEINTPGGLQGVRLIPADLVFEWLMRDNPELAKAMGSAGATVYMHQLAGFKVSSGAITPSQPPVNYHHHTYRLLTSTQHLAGLVLTLITHDTSKPFRISPLTS